MSNAVPLCLAILLGLTQCYSSRLLNSDIDGGLKLEAQSELNMRPLIGVLSQSGDPAPKGYSYIAASYIKFLESAGARVVPVLNDMPKEEVVRLFKSVNGFLIPGGAQRLEPGFPFFDTATHMLDLVTVANDKGDYFPIHGTCLGFEALAVIVSRNHSVLDTFDSTNLPSPLFYTDEAQKSRFFSSLPPQVVEHLKSRPYAMQNHEYGLPWTAVAENPKLSELFNILSLSVDRNGKLYVSTMEAKDYPITATQWHPEKNAFEWTPDKDIPHHPDAIEVTQHANIADGVLSYFNGNSLQEVANFVVGEARKNFHGPSSQADEEDMLIYNWPPSYTGKHKYKGEEVDFDQSYFFPPYSEFKRILQQRRAERHADGLLSEE